MAKSELRDVPPDPPKSRKVMEGSQIPSIGKMIAILFLLLFLIGMLGAGIFAEQINNYFNEKFVTVKEVEIEKIKWVEHPTMPTHMMIESIKPSVDPDVAKKIGDAVDKYSKEYQLPKKLILSIIFHESSYDLFAKSKAGAIGLMQPLPKYHQDKIDDLGIKDKRKLYHIDNNINLGCRIWKEYYDLSKKDLDETFHRYLSKNASEDVKNKYKTKILETWARLEFLEFQYENGHAKEKEKIDEAAKRLYTN